MTEALLKHRYEVAEQDIIRALNALEQAKKSLDDLASIIYKNNNEKGVPINWG